MTHPGPAGPLRILHLTAGSDAGGLSRYVHDLCAAMHARGHVVAVAGERGAWHEIFEKAPWPWVDAPLKGGPLALRRAAGTLRAWMEDHPVDVLHTHYRRATLVARKIQKGEGVRGGVRIPILYTVHQPGISLGLGRRWLTDFGDLTHVASEEAREWLLTAGRVEAGRIALVHHGIKVEEYPVADDATRRDARAGLGLPDDATVAAFVGRFDVPKNEGWVIDVALAARDRLPEVRFVLCGEGPHLPLLRRRIEAGGLGGRVILTTRRGALPVYQAADALLVPSLREGFSLVTAEAMCVGVPVLRTRTGGCAALIRENVTGRSTPIDRGAFVGAAMEFLSDRGALRGMSAGCAVHVREHFAYERQVERTIELYRRLGGFADRDFG